MNVSVRDLKSRLSCYLRQVQRGETVVVTYRGKPIALLVPLPSRLLEERLATLPGINAGTGGKPRGATRPVRVKPGQKDVSDIVVEERRQ
ncbi:MAG: type II toxin-antitoxin system prevent-host-death family antitoxin [Gemmatimonadetes bacterium]|nr:type II toxin-antitoxin system prevent-host-death family antitoxin [Gemmatimonadota bacterium]MXY84033.1 type II toxin-antitoxin system prevent-host-death family antitoxin [Gemmatimonadota bacterium]MYB67291.1 type II toxin-antitoxin system prevent-host-death family antitoxin [Gemmatimonadota bacterium]